MARRWPGPTRGVLARQPAGEPQDQVRQRQALEREQRVVPGKTAGDADQAPDVPRRAEHARPAPRGRQAECSAAMPPGQVAVADTRSEARAPLDHAREGRLVGEAADALGQIAIGRLVPGDPRAEPGQDGERVGVVGPPQRRRRHGRELEAKKPAARHQHAPGFGQGTVDPGDVADAERDGVGIDAAIRKRQAFGIGAQPLDRAQPVGVDGAVTADLEHRGIDVAHDDARRLAASGEPVQDPKRDVAGAARDVEQADPGLRRQPVDHRRLPQAVDADAHQVVHQVVAGGDPCEHRADQPRLVPRPHLLVAEGGGEPLTRLVGRVGHGRVAPGNAGHGRSRWRCTRGRADRQACPIRGA